MGLTVALVGWSVVPALAVDCTNENDPGFLNPPCDGFDPNSIYARGLGGANPTPGDVLFVHSKLTPVTSSSAW